MSDQSPLERATAFLADEPSDNARQAEVEALGDRIVEALRTVYDPEIPVNIFELGLIYKVDVEDGNRVQVDMTLTSPMCPVAESLPEEVRTKVEAVPGVTGASVDVVWDPPWHPSMMTEEAQLELGMLY